MADGRATLVFELAHGLALGLSPNDGIAKVESRAAAELRVAPPVGLRLEVAFVRFVGRRDEQDASCVGLTALPLVSWHFLRVGRSSVAFSFGLGGAWFSRPFPPFGTALNGYSALGLGARLAIGPRWFLTADVRGFHHSNGRGFAADNPAIDGVGFDLGVAAEAW